MNNHTYQNFDLSIEPNEGGYRSRILSAPSGQGECDFLLPFSLEELQTFLALSKHTADILRLTSSEVKSTESAAPLTIQRFGERLFDAAFAGDVGVGLLRSLDEAKRNGAGLRIRLRLDSSLLELAELPWEYLYARPLDRFLLLSNQIVLVRYLEVAHQIKPLQVRAPLHILIIVSDPSDAVLLDVEAEWTRVNDALQPLQAEGLITLERLDQATLAELQDRLQQMPAIHIVHFIGHGYFDEVDNIGGLLLETETGQAESVDAAKLTTLFLDHSSLRLIFLNSCYGARSSAVHAFTGIAQQLILQGIPAVLAMQFSITNEAAITLAQTFYKSTANGYPIDAALAEARKGIYLSGNEEEWATPVLFSRADDNQIFISPKGDPLIPSSEPSSRYDEGKPPARNFSYIYLFVGVLVMLVAIAFYSETGLPTTMLSNPTPTATLFPPTTKPPNPTPTSTLFPPRAEDEVLVLVADILVAGCVNEPACPADPDDVTQRLVSTMRDDLAEYPEIRIERLHQFIEEAREGSERAMEIGRSPEFDATFVIWGNYHDEPHAYLFFDIMDTELPFFGSSYKQDHGFDLIKLPSKFNFKVSLGQQWASITAFATGLTLFQAGNRYHLAEPFFNTAAQALSQPDNIDVDPELIYHLHFYRATNNFYLGRSDLARADLDELYEQLDPLRLTKDELGASTLRLLGHVYSNLGKLDQAMEYYEKGLTISQETENLQLESVHLGGLGNAYSELGEPDKAREYYEQGLAISQKITYENGNIMHLGNLGILYSDLGEPDKAIEFHEQALAISRKIGDRRNEGSSIGSLGGVYHDLGEYEQAMEYFEQALDISREIRDRLAEGFQLGNMGVIYHEWGEYEKAIEHFELALDILKEIQNPEGESVHLGNLGGVYYDLGDYDMAIEKHEQALKIAREIKDREVEGQHLNNLGVVYSDLGEPDQAIEMYNQALDIAREIKNRSNESLQLGNLGSVYRGTREYEKAIAYTEQALAISREIKNPSKQENQLNTLAIIYSDLGDYEKVIEYSEEGLAIAQKIKDRRGEHNHLKSLGRGYSGLGNHDKAIKLYEQALALSQKIEDPSRESADLGSLGGVHATLGDDEKAIEFYEQALAISQEIEDFWNEGNLLYSLGNVYRNSGNGEKAIALYEQGLAVLQKVEGHDFKMELLYSLGGTYFDLGEHEKAIDSYEQGLVLARENKSSHNEGMFLGILWSTYFQLGEEEKAMDYLTQSFVVLGQVKPPFAALNYQGLSIAYNGVCWKSALNREPEVALPFCEEAVNYGSNPWANRGGRGLAYALLGETEKAIADFQFSIDELEALGDPANAPYIAARQGWIDALAAGEDPFTDEVLDQLR